MMTPEEIVDKFKSLWPDSTVYNLPHGNFMALSHQHETPTQPRYIQFKAFHSVCYVYDFCINMYSDMALYSKSCIWLEV
ncbi:Stem-specific protein [Arachis hypogaea]|nr:Stem-specific protein [Arachis hypogaea]